MRDEFSDDISSYDVFRDSRFRSFVPFYLYVIYTVAFIFCTSFHTFNEMSEETD